MTASWLVALACLAAFGAIVLNIIVTRIRNRHARTLFISKAPLFGWSKPANMSLGGE